MTVPFRLPDRDRVAELRALVAKKPAQRWRWQAGQLLVSYVAGIDECVAMVRRAEFPETGYFGHRFGNDRRSRRMSGSVGAGDEHGGGIIRQFGSRNSALRWCEEHARKLVRRHDRATRPRKKR